MFDKKDTAKKKPKAWIIDVNMGYGHQRTAFPLRDLAPNKKIISANSYKGIPQKDRKIWERSRKFYEFISKFKRIPFIGSLIWSIFDSFQEVVSYYPKKDLSSPNLSLRVIFSTIRKGWGKDLIERLKLKDLPLVTTFFTSAFIAEEHSFPNRVYCIVCDADIARTWAPLEPQKSKIKYLAPCNWVVSRLQLYGVKKENIYLTGYPLPKENIGSEEREILKEDLGHRIVNLDPDKKYRLPYRPLIKNYVGVLPQKSNHPLTLMFAVGGAGAQKELGMQIVESLKGRIRKNDIRVILVAGIREEVKSYFQREARKLGLGNTLGKSIEILFDPKIQEYFKKFNKALRKTDILWTKPSELSFYAGLGLPIIIAPCIGSHERFNRKWLLRIGAGIVQQNPKYTEQWLFDLIKGGRLAEAAMQGFMEIENLGAFNIEKVIANPNSNHIIS